MKVWELIAELSKRPAGDEVLINIGPTLNVEADGFEFDNDGEIVIRTDRDVEVVMSDCQTVMLSDLVKVEDEEVEQ